MSRFAGRTVLITGGARGQGLAFALAFAGEGANVVLCDIAGKDVIETGSYRMSSLDDLTSARVQVEQVGAACLTVTADVRDLAQMQAAVESALERFGSLDILCANAGICTYAPVHELTSQQWRETLDVNLTGVFNSVRAALPAMLEAGYGRIVATGSMAGRSGHPNIAHYAASKWGLIGFIKSVAVEVGRRGITANVVAPTNVDSPMIQNAAFYDLIAGRGETAPSRDEVAKALRRMTAMGVPWVEPADVARAVLFLADEASRYITGEVLHVAAGANAMNSA